MKKLSSTIILVMTLFSISKVKSSRHCSQPQIRADEILVVRLPIMHTESLSISQQKCPMCLEVKTNFVKSTRCNDNTILCTDCFARLRQKNTGICPYCKVEF